MPIDTRVTAVTYGPDGTVALGLGTVALVATGPTASATRATGCGGGRAVEAEPWEKDPRLQAVIQLNFLQALARRVLRGEEPGDDWRWLIFGERHGP